MSSTRTRTLSDNVMLKVRIKAVLSYSCNTSLQTHNTVVTLAPFLWITCPHVYRTLASLTLTLGYLENCFMVCSVIVILFFPCLSCQEFCWIAKSCACTATIITAFMAKLVVLNYLHLPTVIAAGLETVIILICLYVSPTVRYFVNHYHTQATCGRGGVNIPCISFHPS